MDLLLLYSLFLEIVDLFKSNKKFNKILYENLQIVLLIKHYTECIIILCEILKYHYCGVSNVNYWIISVSEEIKEIIKKQMSCIKGSIFVFYRRSSINHMWKKNKKKV